MITDQANQTLRGYDFPVSFYQFVRFSIFITDYRTLLYITRPFVFCISHYVQFNSIVVICFINNTDLVCEFTDGFNVFQ